MTTEPAARATAAGACRGDVDCELTVIVKTLNEEKHIRRTLECVLAAVAQRDAEVIVADSLSLDRTTEIACRFPVRVVQLERGAERGCGVGAQLGYQYARGRFLLVLDGDMDLQPGFVEVGLARLQADPGLAGVGGTIADLNLVNIEYRARRARQPRDARPGQVDRLNGGGLFRRQAIVDAGYLTNRNLHACEELEQALRLRYLGWRMERLPVVAALHHGHTAATWTLMRRRWRSRYACGAGELLRAAAGQPWFGAALASQRHLIAVLGWWACLVAAMMLSLHSGSTIAWTAVLALLGIPPGLMMVRRRSIALGVYSVAAWCLDAAGLLRGVWQPQVDPRQPVAARVLR